MENRSLISVVVGEDDAKNYDSTVYSTPSWGNNNKYTKLATFNSQDDERDQKPTSCGLLSCLVGSLCFQMGIFSCYTVSPREEAVLLDFGKYNGTEKEPGCHWVSVAGRTLMKVSTKVRSIEIPATKTIDSNGNPLIINGILAYQVSNSKKAMLDIENYQDFVWTQAVAAMKQVVSRFPYESDDVCLRRDADVISKELVQRIQERVHIAGIAVLSFTFNEISYAVEIASAMLKKQQAEAILGARATIVKGAVGIAGGAVRELIAGGLALDDKAKVQIVSNLLVVTCSERA